MKVQTFIKLSAPNDNDGNPRRLFIVNEFDTDNLQHGANRLAVIDEDYDGIEAVRKVYPNAVNTGEVMVTAAVYREWLRIGANDEKLRQEENNEKN